MLVVESFIPIVVSLPNLFNNSYFDVTKGTKHNINQPNLSKISEKQKLNVGFQEQIHSAAIFLLPFLVDIADIYCKLLKFLRILDFIDILLTWFFFEKWEHEIVVRN